MFCFLNQKKVNYGNTFVVWFIMCAINFVWSYFIYSDFDPKNYLWYFLIGALFSLIVIFSTVKFGSDDGSSDDKDPFIKDTSSSYIASCLTVYASVELIILLIISLLIICLCKALAKR